MQSWENNVLQGRRSNAASSHHPVADDFPVTVRLDVKKILEASFMEILFCRYFQLLHVVVGGHHVLLQRPEHNKSSIISRSDEISGMAKHLLHSVSPGRRVKLR